MDIWTNRPPNKQTNEQTNHWTDIRNTRRLAIRAHSSSVPYDLTIVGRVYSQFRLMAVLYISAISIVFAPLNSIIRPSEKKNSEQGEESNVIVLLCVRYLQKWFSWAHTHTHSHTFLPNISCPSLLTRAHWFILYFSMFNVIRPFLCMFLIVFSRYRRIVGW